MIYLLFLVFSCNAMEQDGLPDFVLIDLEKVSKNEERFEPIPQQEIHHNQDVSKNVHWAQPLTEEHALYQIDEMNENLSSL